MFRRQGRGSAVMVCAVVVLCLLLVHSEVAQAAVYSVGGSGGWTFNVSGWTKGKRFRAGDVLGKYGILYTSLRDLCIVASHLNLI